MVQSNSPTPAGPSLLRDCLEAEWLEYPILGHLVGNVSTLLQRDGSNDGVHGVRQNEFETRSLEVIRLRDTEVSWGAQKDVRRRAISNLARSPPEDLLHFVFLCQLGELGPIGQEALGLWREISEAIQGRVGEGRAAVRVRWCGGISSLGVLDQRKRGLQLHNTLACPSS